MPGGFNSSAIKSHFSKNWVPLILTASFSSGPLSNLPNDLLPKQKRRVGSMALFLSTLSVLAFPWHLQALEAHLEVAAMPSSAVKNSSSSKVINRSLPLSILNSTCVTSDVTHRQERLPSIRKKRPVWCCKPSSTVSTMSMAMLILKEYNLTLTSSRLTISTHCGIGFVKTLCLCTMISFLIGLPPSIPTPVPFLAAAVHPPSSFDHKLLVLLPSPHSPPTRFSYYT